MHFYWAYTETWNLGGPVVPCSVSCSSRDWVCLDLSQPALPTLRAHLQEAQLSSTHVSRLPPTVPPQGLLEYSSCSSLQNIATHYPLGIYASLPRDAAALPHLPITFNMGWPPDLQNVGI